MPTKAQSKTAIDNAVVDVKADFDNILPSGVNIKTGFISFGPTVYNVVLDAGGSAATALSWFTTIQTNLTNAARVFSVARTDRRATDMLHEYSIFEVKMTVRIINF